MRGRKNVIRKQKSVDFEQKCKEIELAFLRSLENVEGYNDDHLVHVYLDLLRSAMASREKRKYY